MIMATFSMGVRTSSIHWQPMSFAMARVSSGQTWMRRTGWLASAGSRSPVAGWVWVMMSSLRG